MSNSSTDLRGLLHYVPQFRGKLFVIDLEWGVLSESSQAEVVMDLRALQSIGVRLLIVSSPKELEGFLDWAVDHEFRSSMVADEASVERISDILSRGQAALLTRTNGLLSSDVVKLSVQMGASKIIALSDFKPLEANGQQVKFLRVSEIDKLEVSLLAKEKSLLKLAGQSCEAGVERVHLLDATVPGVLLDELFSNEGVGTMVYGGSYREIRLLKEEDISELLSMIGRSVRRTHLVARSYEQIVESLNDYAVMEVDGHVVGCVALYEYGKRGEIACLYVKQSHEGTGYGADLVRFMEQQAKNRGLNQVFAVTNRAAHFFTDQMAYAVLPIENLPMSRLEALQNSGRDSQAFVKDL